MIQYFIIGGFVGLVLGYIMAALLAFSNKDLENENLLDYCTKLEDELDEKNSLIK